MGAAVARPPPIWRLGLLAVGAISLLLLFTNSDSLSYVHRRMLLSAGPGGKPKKSTNPEPELPLVGRVAGSLQRMPDVPENSTAFRDAFRRCRPPAKGGAPLPRLKRARTFEGLEPSRAGNATIVTTLHVDRLHLLEAHCAVWPHTIMAAVYAPISLARRVVCLSEDNGMNDLRQAKSWFSWLGFGAGDCPHAGWSVERLSMRVRQVHRRAQETGQCNLRIELWTERVSPDQGPLVGLLPQASLQNRAIQSLQPRDAPANASVVLLDSDMVSVDIWQLVNWPTRWERAVAGFDAGRVLVLPAFQLTPAGVAAAAENAGGRERADVAAMRTALTVVTSEAGKFPLKQLFLEGKAGVYADHGFASSQSAALPVLWFEAGDMHAVPDDGYPVAPQPGFAPFTFMRLRDVPWADERLRGSYYQRAWQAVAVRAAGMWHVVQPNSFALQLPHDAGYTRGETALPNFLQMEPSLREMVEEVGRGEYVPVTAFGHKCEQQQPAELAALPAETGAVADS